MSKCPHHLNVFLKASLRQRSDYSEDTGSQKCEVFILQCHLVHSATFIWPALIDQAKRRHRVLQRLLYLINNMSSSQTAAAHPNQRGWNLSLALPDQKHPAPRRYRTDRRVITWLFESELTVLCFPPAEEERKCSEQRTNQSEGDLSAAGGQERQGGSTTGLFSCIHTLQYQGRWSWVWYKWCQRCFMRLHWGGK